MNNFLRKREKYLRFKWFDVTNSDPQCVDIVNNFTGVIAPPVTFTFDTLTNCIEHVNNGMYTKILIYDSLSFYEKISFVSILYYQVYTKTTCPLQKRRTTDWSAVSLSHAAQATTTSSSLPPHSYPPISIFLSMISRFFSYSFKWYTIFFLSDSLFFTIFLFFYRKLLSSFVILSIDLFENISRNKRMENLRYGIIVS